METIAELERERAALMVRVSEIDTLLEDYRAWERRASALIGRRANAPVDDPVATFVSEENKSTPIREFEGAVATILRETEHPLDRSEFLSALNHRGVTVGGMDPRNTLSARLSRLAGVVNIKGHGYWDQERDYPPAGYIRKPESHEITLEKELGILAR